MDTMLDWSALCVINNNIDVALEPLLNSGKVSYLVLTVSYDKWNDSCPSSIAVNSLSRIIAKELYSGSLR